MGTVNEKSDQCLQRMMISLHPWKTAQGVTSWWWERHLQGGSFPNFHSNLLPSVYKHSQWLLSNTSCQPRQWRSEQKCAPRSPATPVVKIHHQGTVKPVLGWWGWGGAGPPPSLSTLLTQVWLCLLGLGKSLLSSSEPHVSSKSWHMWQLYVCKYIYLLCQGIGEEEAALQQKPATVPTAQGSRDLQDFSRRVLSFLIPSRSRVAQQGGLWSFGTKRVYCSQGQKINRSWDHGHNTTPP